MRRETLWLSATFAQATLGAASTAALVTSLNASALALRPFTIVRTRGYMSVRSDGFAVSTAEIYEAAYGEIVVTDQASAAGVASVPTPAAEDALDWHVYERSGGRTQISAAGLDQFNVNVRQDIDSKAMRKVDVGEDLITVVETSSASLGAIVSFYTRVLIKLY